jgi:prepilin-type processing-associated H-X9-DG protein
VSDFELYPQNTTPDSPEWHPWGYLIRPYCGGDADLFMCPSRLSDDPTYQYNDSGTRSVVDDILPGLGLGGLLPFDFDHNSPTPESQVLVPSEMLALGELWGFGWPGSPYVPDFFRVNPRLRRLPHGRSVNAVFCDCHLESGVPDLIQTERDLSPGALPRTVRYKSDEALAKRWNKDNQAHAETWPKR